MFTHSVTVNTAQDVRRWEHDFTVKGVSELGELKSRLIDAVRKVPGVLSDPGPEALIVNLNEADPTALTIRILWWTKVPHQHQMLTSYYAVLSIVWQTLNSLHGVQGTAPTHRAA